MYTMVTFLGSFFKKYLDLFITFEHLHYKWDVVLSVNCMHYTIRKLIKQKKYYALIQLNMEFEQLKIKIIMNTEWSFEQI